jgi:hypothetical protein
VVEGGGLPGRRAVAYGAVEGKPGSLVIRVGRAVIRSKVAVGATRIQACVIAVHVASGAREICVRACEREPSLTVIESRVRPTRCGVADRAIRREPKLGVVRVRGLVKVRNMARCTVLWSASVFAIDVATCTGHGYVRTCQRESGKRVVIERRR